MTTDERQIKAAAEAYATYGQQGGLRAAPPSDGCIRAMLAAAQSAVPQAQSETVNAVERSLVRQIVLSSTPGTGDAYYLRERMLAEIDKLPILSAAPIIAEQRQKTPEGK